MWKLQPLVSVARGPEAANQVCGRIYRSGKIVLQVTLPPDQKPACIKSIASLFLPPSPQDFFFLFVN